MKTLSSSLNFHPIVPFPQVRRQRFIRANAVRLAAVPAQTAEKLLAATLRQQRKAMTRKGIASETIDFELRALETAIRAELWRQFLTSGGAA